MRRSRWTFRKRASTIYSYLSTSVGFWPFGDRWGRDTDTLERLMQDPDPSLLFQVERDLLGKPASVTAKVQREIAKIGYGSLLLARRNKDGQWGNDVYVPKWTCTHYVLFELVQLGTCGDQAACRESADLLLRYPRGSDGG